MELARYKVILAYDGSTFSGLQRQAEGRSVQGVVEAALRPLGWQGKSILAAGRTDAGVHASGQVIAFDLAWRDSPGAAEGAQRRPAGQCGSQRSERSPGGFPPALRCKVARL